MFAGAGSIAGSIPKSLPWPKMEASRPNDVKAFIDRAFHHVENTFLLVIAVCVPVVSGTDSAAVRETTPRTPVKPIKSGYCQDGATFLDWAQSSLDRPALPFCEIIAFTHRPSGAAVSAETGPSGCGLRPRAQSSARATLLRSTASERRPPRRAAPRDTLPGGSWERAVKGGECGGSRYCP
jgi:hypothetical protein